MEENVIQINGGLMINADVSVKNVMYVKKIIHGFLLQGSCEYGKYLASIIDDSVIMRDENMESYNEETKTIATKFNEK